MYYFDNETGKKKQICKRHEFAVSETSRVYIMAQLSKNPNAMFTAPCLKCHHRVTVDAERAEKEATK